MHRIPNLDVEMVDPAEINGCGDPLADREEVHVALVVLDLEALEEGGFEVVVEEGVDEGREEFLVRWSDVSVVEVEC